MTPSQQEMTHSPRGHSHTLKLVLLAIILVLGWLLCTLAQVQKYLPMNVAAAVSIFGCFLVLGGLLWLRRQYVGRDLGLLPLALAFLALLISFVVLYPKAQRHTVGQGSDREDALRVELAAVLHHQYPYDARTFLNHPPTPLPGAMLLAAPFYLAGRVAIENIVWAAAFCCFLLCFFRCRRTALVYFVLFLITALENLNDFDVGGDYVTNIMYVCIALFCFAKATDRDASWPKVTAAVTFLGIALSSRVVYVVVLPPMFAYVAQRNRLGRTLALCGGVLLAAALVTLPVFFPHPIAHLYAQLNQNANKLTVLPSFLTGVTLPTAALLVASAAFFFRMSLPRVFLLSGVAASILVVPPMIFFVRTQGGFTKPLSTDLEYLAVGAMLLGLWALSEWERDASRITTTIACKDGARSTRQ